MVAFECSVLETKFYPLAVIFKWSFTWEVCWTKPIWDFSTVNFFFNLHDKSQYGWPEITQKHATAHVK